MTRQEEVYDIPAFLAILNNEEELIIKPLQLGKGADRFEYFVHCFQGSASETGAIECGKVVSRLNKSLFDYQIGKMIDFQTLFLIRLPISAGDKTNASIFNAIFSQRILLTQPGTKRVTSRFSHSLSLDARIHVL